MKFTLLGAATMVVHADVPVRRAPHDSFIALHLASSSIS
jgi:hypothetical protein